MSRRRLERAVRRAGIAPVHGPGAVVGAGDLEGLPGPARRFLAFAGVPGAPRDVRLAARLPGRFRQAPDAPWQPITLLQYNTAPPAPARVFVMRLRIRGLPVHGRDVYAHGEGSMVIRPLDLVTVQDARGPEFDMGELVTWLNDAVMLAPSMLLAPGVSWSPRDDASFDVTIEDGANRVSATVTVDAGGAPVDFRTEDRWYAEPGGTPARTPWRTPVEGWRRVGDRMLPTRGRAVWERPGGDYCYAELSFADGVVRHGGGPEAL